MSRPSPENTPPENPQSDNPSKTHFVRRRFNRFRQLAGLMIWLLIVAGLTLRFTVRDEFHCLGLIYYVTPIPTLPIWVFLAWLLGWSPTTNRSNSIKQQPRSLFRRSRIAWVVGIAFVIWTMYSEFAFRGEQPSPDDLRIMFWNISRIQAGISRIASQVNSVQPACFGLVEADRNHILDLAEWQKIFPDYKIMGTTFGGLIAVKGDVISQKDVSLQSESNCKQFDLRVNNQEFTLILVDISSDLQRSRRIPIQELSASVQQLTDRPVIIMGDFNTPDDSALFEPLRKQFRLAFRERGSGYAATWPMPLPVLTLDQVWLNDRVKLSQCLHDWTFSSDHRPVICDLSVVAQVRKGTGTFSPINNGTELIE